jgi:Tfp pilus assembly protein PilF
VLFVGLDGGDWQLLDRLVADGAMPNLARLEREGARGVLLSEHPPLSPLLWTTMMTGVSPLVHGILDFSRFAPGSGERVPIESGDRRAPAIWNLATWGGKRSAVFGLWATFPAEPVDGLLVSDRLFGFLDTRSQVAPGTVYPAARQAWAVAALAETESAVGYDALHAYLPWLSPGEYAERAESGDPYGHPVTALRRILVETRVYDRLFRSALDTDRPDLAILYLQGTDSIGHVFAPYAAPRQAAIAERDFARYRDVPARYFHEVDGLLGAYRELAERRGAVLVLASDHGFHWLAGRPERLSSVDNATAAKWHRPEGIFLIWGLGSKPPGRGGARQLAATLAALAGLPPGKDLQGPPLSPVAPAAGPAIDYAAIFSRLGERSAAPPPAAAASPGKEELAKLRALGYLGAGEPDRAPESVRATGSTRTAGSFNNEALIRKSQGDLAGARAAFEQALAIDPNLPSALWNLSDLLHESGDAERSDELLVRAWAAGLADGAHAVVGRAIGYQRAGDAARSVRLLDAALAARAEVPELWLFRGRFRVETRDCAGAREDFARAIELAPGDATAYASAGVAELCLEHPAAAADLLRRSLDLDPDQPKVRAMLAELAAAGASGR